MDVPPLRQNTLIVLAVPAELVPRLWYSALKVRACALPSYADIHFQNKALMRIKPGLNAKSCDLPEALCDVRQSRARCLETGLAADVPVCLVF